MSLLEVTNLSQCFMEKALYVKAGFELYKGEHIGVVGQNGAGKSTLIKILLGEVVPDEGEIKWQPNIKIGHLDQHAEIDKNSTVLEYLQSAFSELYMIEKEMTDLYQKSSIEENEEFLVKAANYQEMLILRDFYSLDSEINKVATGLGLTAIGMNRYVGELSGGQRAKLIMAKLLLSNPNLLLLDEPTNFLDKEHVDWLSDYLISFDGAFLVVSHDIHFLKKISTGICDIEFGTIKKYHGNYTKFLNQKAHLRDDYIRQYQSQQKKIEKTEAYIRKNRAGVNSRMAQGRQKQLDRMERIAPPSFTEKTDIKFSEIELNVGTALNVNNLEVGYYYPLLPKLNFTVTAGQKLVITGFNGIGKSTLLKTLISDIPCISGGFHFAEQVKIGYYEQDLIWEDVTKTPFQIIADAYPRLNVKEVRRSLAQCSVKEEHVLRSITTLSGGEQSKVKLCKMLLTPCNFLILDEPTNHLDIETKESLKNAMKKFEGCIILVSHEEKFYKDLADKVLHIENGN